MAPDDVKKTGTTTLGIVCKDGVVIGTERRATMGTLIAHKKTQKLFRVDDHIALTTAGLVGDAQVLARLLSAEVELYRMKREAPISVQAAATLMANILNQRKFAPYYVQLIIGGVDASGGHVYSLDAAGGAIPDIYTTTGSGSPYVFGVLEDQYRDDVTVDGGMDLAIRSLNAAMRRDSASGDGMDIAVITQKDGFRLATDDEVASRKKKLGLN
ncbi:MAG: proteasome endopeptidase complex, archaeal, beta subunit [Thermoplasmata archaeon HGW-Thermoplasmata-1]|nr:MAG: proteasome endopeptidase complex, archaeal, beta subunit [Thermoplasmata archaeon HGW-Thermoplasmata-1]